MAEQTIIIERYGERSWKAYFLSDKDTLGVGRSKGEAVASLYTNNVGKLILENPKRFGLRIEDADAAANESHPSERRGDNRTRRVDIPLTSKQWDEIISALKNDFHLKVARFFRKNDNKPASPKQINRRVGGFMSRFSTGVPESINSVMRKNNLKYRLLPIPMYRKNRIMWEDDPLRFWIME